MAQLNSMALSLLDRSCIVEAGIDEDGASSTGKLGNKVLLEEDGLLGKRGSGSASVRVAQQ